MLQSKQRYNQFKRYWVLELGLLCTNWVPARGSPHDHILWLENDPREPVSENIPQTITLLTDLCSVSDDYIQDKITNQIHRHTFTCTKRGETSCRFNIPFWPMKETRILITMARTEQRRAPLQQQSKKVLEAIENKTYVSIDAFVKDNCLRYRRYLNLIRSTLKRPSVLFKQTVQQIFTNTFNLRIANVLKSNTDFQFILD